MARLRPRLFPRLPVSGRDRPPPSGPPVMRMVWRDVLFAHGRVDADALRSRLPAGLELDTFAGEAWVGVVPFLMTGVGPPGLDWLPGLSRFLELNVRTYVTAGGRPGVWFFSLDAASPVAVRAARATFHLPYYDARMSCRRTARGWRYRSRRTHRGAPSAEIDVSWRPAGPPRLHAPGTLEHWFTERYVLYTVDGAGRVLAGEVDHAPWRLRPARAAVRVDTMAAAAGLHLPEGTPLHHAAERVDVLAWWATPSSDATAVNRRS